MPHHRHRSALVAASLVTALVSAAPGARAEGWHAGGRLGVATLRHGSLGPALDVHGAYELSDMFDAVVQLTASRHDGGSGTDAFSASGGLAYKIDVFEWIPYVGVLAGYYRYAEPLGQKSQSAGYSVHVGIDYLFSRSFAVGADLGFHGVLGDSPPQSLQMTILGGAEYRFGW